MTSPHGRHVPTMDAPDLAALPPEVWATAEHRAEIVRRALAGAQTRAAIEALAEDVGVHPTTLYRWIAQYERDGRTSAMVPRSRRGQRIKRHFADAVEALIRETIETYYLRRERPSIAQTVVEVRRRCHAAGLTLPCDSTIRRRIAEVIDARDAHKRRHGTRAARERFAPKPGHFPTESANVPLGVVQIDHTKLDVMVVDDVYRQPIGRPWLTLAIDVFSRMVVGFYVSLDPPSAASVGLCLSQAILPKAPWLLRRGLDVVWPCAGLPRTVHADNGREFRGSMLRRACAEYGITLEWRLVKRPEYGGHIERLLGTTLGELHAVPGTTFSNPHERGDYDAAGQAIFTLDELEVYIATFFLGVYHARVHSALDTSPRAQYERGLTGAGTDAPPVGAPRIPTDADRLRLDFMPYVERPVRPDGVRVDGIKYYSELLGRFIHARDPKNRRAAQKLIFRRDPRDVSVLYVWEPDLQQYFRVPYRNIARPPMSLWELRAARRAAKQAGRHDVNEAAIFDAYTKLRAQEAAASRETMTVRRAKQRRRHHERARADAPSTPGRPSPASRPASSAGPNLTLVASTRSRASASPPPVSHPILPFDDIEELAPTPYWASRRRPPRASP